MRRFNNPGYNGWAAVITVVLIAECLDSRTMSDAFRHSPNYIRVPVWAITTAHLFGVLPERLDPFTYLSRVPAPRRTHVLQPGRLRPGVGPLHLPLVASPGGPGDLRH